MAELVINGDEIDFNGDTNRHYEVSNGSNKKVRVRMTEIDVSVSPSKPNIVTEMVIMPGDVFYFPGTDDTDYHGTDSVELTAETPHGIAADAQGAVRVLQVVL